MSRLVDRKKRRTALHRALSPALEGLEQRTMLAGDGLSAVYYDNADFTGASVARVDATVNFNWKGGTPAPHISSDTFSVRWTGQVQPSFSQTYTFSTVSDDGVRLWVNGQQIINQWTAHAAREDSGTITLQAGSKYDIKLEYFNNFGGSVAQLSWASNSQAKQIIPQAQLYSTSSGVVPPPVTPPVTPPIVEPPVTPPATGTGNGLSAVYYDNADFTGASLGRIDPTINFNWKGGTPAPHISSDTFSVRWTGQLLANYSQTYTFSTISDDGVRLWVNGQQIINQWNAHAAREDFGTITLQAGTKYDIKLEYYNNYGGSVAQLFWASTSQAKEIIPQSQLFSASSVVTTPPPVTPPPVTDSASLRVSSNGRYLVNADGSPFFYMADTAWQMPAKLTRADIDYYLAARAAQGFNVIQIVALDSTYKDKNPYGQTPLLNNNPATPNSAYFDQIDCIVNKAATYGIYVAIVATWGKNVADPTSRIFDTTSAYTYGHFLGARYKDATNVIWINGGDWTVPDATTANIWRALAQGIGDGDQGLHLMTFHPRGNQASRSYWTNESWLDFDMVQSGHTRDSAAYDLITAEYIKSPVMPVIEGEMNYEDIPVGAFQGTLTGPLLDSYDVRKKAYLETFAGAAVVAYGANEVFQFYTPGAAADMGAKIDWKTALNLPGATEMQYLSDLMQSRTYLTRVPDQTLITSTTYTGTDHIQATRDSAGTYAMIYSASGKSFTVNMSKITGGAVNAAWYDPRTGKITSIGQFADTGTRTFVPPTSGYGQDWVLTLDRA
jgi:hypothetical protein